MKIIKLGQKKKEKNNKLRARNKKEGILLYKNKKNYK